MPVKMLVVHDFRTVRTLTQHILAEYSDAAVDWFTSALDAAVTLQKNKYDIILCGLEMPNMNGIEFRERILASTNKDTPLVVMISSRDADRESSLLEQGINNILRIPCTSSLQIREIIDKVINPRSIRAHTRYSIPDTKATITFGDHKIQADVINISMGGVLCELDCPAGSLDLMRTGRMTIRFSDEYGKKEARGVVPSLLKLTVKSWHRDHSIHRISLVFKFDGLPGEASDVFEEVFQKAEQDLSR